MKKLVSSIVAAAASGVVIASSVCLSAAAADPVAPDSTPPTVKVPVGVFDSYYTGTKALKGKCTGHKQRVKLTAKADPSGSFAPADSRLKRGTVEVVLGGTLDDEFVLRSVDAKVR